MRKDGKNVTHSGNQAGAASLTRISPERGAALVIMTNLEDAPLGQLANQIGPDRARAGAVRAHNRRAYGVTRIQWLRGSRLFC